MQTHRRTNHRATDGILRVGRWITLAGVLVLLGAVGGAIHEGWFLRDARSTTAEVASSSTSTERQQVGVAERANQYRPIEVDVIRHDSAVTFVSSSGDVVTAELRSGSASAADSGGSVDVLYRASDSSTVSVNDPLSIFASTLIALSIGLLVVTMVPMRRRVLQGGLMAKLLVIPWMVGMVALAVGIVWGGGTAAIAAFVEDGTPSESVIERATQDDDAPRNPAATTTSCGSHSSYLGLSAATLECDAARRLLDETDGPDQVEKLEGRGFECGVSTDGSSRITRCERGAESVSWGQLG